MAPFEALYGRPCRSPSCWLEFGEKLILGPDFVRGSSEKIDLIRLRMKEAQSRQKSYVDNHRKPLEFSIGDLVFIRVSPLKGVMRFSTTGKFAPRYIGPFSIIERIGPVAYRVSLPAHLSGIHDVFHSPDLQELEISPNLSIVQQPIRLLDMEVRHLQNKDVPLVKVQRSANPNDCTWQTREFIERSYPGFLSLL